MKEQLVSLKTAKSAKKQGFTVLCDYVYDVVADEVNPVITQNQTLSGNFLSYFHDRFISTPSQSLLQKWLREEKDILVEVTFSSRLSRKLYEAAHEKPSLNFSWKIYTSIKDPSHFFPEFWTDDTFETYEEALEKGLQEALKMVR